MAEASPSRGDEWVSFVCVSDGKRLRVRITTPGYFNAANCMFPRDMRIEGAHFRTRRENVKLIARGAQYYYSSGSRGAIERVPDPTTGATGAPSATVKAIFEDTTMTDCAVCFERPKNTIINPCGHFYMCHECATQVRACPICRGPVRGLIDRALMMI